MKNVFLSINTEDLQRSRKTVDIGGVPAEIMVSPFSSPKELMVRHEPASHRNVLEFRYIDSEPPDPLPFVHKGIQITQGRYTPDGLPSRPRRSTAFATRERLCLYDPAEAHFAIMRLAVRDGGVRCPRCGYDITSDGWGPLIYLATRRCELCKEPFELDLTLGPS